MNFCVSIILFYFVFLTTFCTANLTPQDCHTSFLTDCCKGYRLFNETCIPVCENGCPEPQICLEPNLCGVEPAGLRYMRKYCGSRLNDNEKSYCDKCFPSFIPKSGYDCKPYCVEKCSNGICDTQGHICKCNKGYEENPNTNLCEPIKLTTREDCVNNNNCQFITEKLISTSTSSGNTVDIQTDESTTDQSSTTVSEEDLIITTVTVNYKNDISNGSKSQEAVKHIANSIEISSALFYLFTSVVVLVLIIILLGYLAQKRMKLVTFNVEKVEKRHSKIVSDTHKQNQQLECTL